MMIILDSAGNLATQKEINDAISGSEKSEMTRSKILKSIGYTRKKIDILKKKNII